ncbi:MAG: AAA family ATPase, partial [Chloroflexi bacterium]|nr:AAA family ATPase [Chloroflexota bacterium]
MLAHPWNIQLLGGLAARQPSTEINRFRSRKIAGVLSLLAYRCPKLVPREELVEQFWGDSGIERGRNGLRVALSDLRGALCADGVRGGVIISIGGMVGLCSELISTDVRSFERSLDAAKSLRGEDGEIDHIRLAVDCYVGDLLPAAYEDWVQPERLRLKESHGRALRRLSYLLEQAGQTEEGLDYALRAASADPLDEKCQIRALRSLLSLGRLKQAQEQYHWFRENIFSALGQEPSPEIQALFRRSVTRRGATITASLSGAGGAASEPALRTAIAGPPAVTGTLLREAPSNATDASVGGLRAALPVRLTRFIGREQAVRDLIQLIDGQEARLVTVVGAPGIGKTRLALEAADCLSRMSYAPSWFVPLADLRDPDRLLDEIARVLQPAAGNEDPLETIARVLSGGRAVLVLDNFEQLVEGGGAAVISLLHRLSGLVCLVTSRQALEVEGEQEYPVGPLELPAAFAGIEALTRSESVRLFMERAQRLRPGLHVTPANAAAVGLIARRLEGIPLGIELAAGWIKTLTLEQIATRLERCLE